jgi:hypothetical protein
MTKRWLDKLLRMRDLSVSEVEICCSDERIRKEFYSRLKVHSKSLPHIAQSSHFFKLTEKTIMDLKEIQDKIVGEWTGKNLLRLSSLTPSDYSSSSDLSVAQAAKGKFLTFNYTWKHENVPQEGMLVVGYDKKQNIATAAWFDSWHMSSKVMSCQGTIKAQGIIDLRGSYEAPPGPDCGWRIIITAPSNNRLQVVMYNCSSEGVEELAVQADYKSISR